MFPPATGSGGGGGGGGPPPRLPGGTAAELEGPFLLFLLLRRLPVPPVDVPVPEGGGSNGVGDLGGGGVGGPLSYSIGYLIVLSESSSLDMAL